MEEKEMEKDNGHGRKPQQSCAKLSKSQLATQNTTVHSAQCGKSGTNRDVVVFFFLIFFVGDGFFGCLFSHIHCWPFEQGLWRRQTSSLSLSLSMSLSLSQQLSMPVVV